MEKADTRNWQSLPSHISYTRIPVNKAGTELCLELTTANGQLVRDTLRLKQKSAFEVLNYSTLQPQASVLSNR